jgi:dTDP-4-dehydrorhamnose 3,5-epimerase-like enzyme
VNTELPQGCRWLRFPERGDRRGSLVALEGGVDVPFSIARAYFVYGTQAGVSRGAHAHHHFHQVAVAVSGGCTMHLDDGRQRADVRLEERTAGLLIPPMVWHEMHDFTPDCVLLVLADAPYEEADYIRDRDVWRRMAQP